MKNKAILVSLITLIALVLALNTVFAASSTGFVTIDQVKINGVVASEDSPAVAGDVSDTVPVEVYFTANNDVSNVKVEVSIDGYKDNIYEETPRFLVVNGSQYVKRFTLKLPSTQDLSDLTEKLSVNVKVTAKDADSVEGDYAVEMQRQLYSLDLMSVDLPNSVSAGSIVPLDIVVQNDGNSRMNDIYVKVTIPELAVNQKVYLGDLGAKDAPDDTYYDTISHTMTKRIFLNLPTNAAAGTYNVNIEAYNYDASSTTKSRLVVSAPQSGSAIPSTGAKTVQIGQDTSYDLVLVNPSDKLVVYSITPESTNGLTVQVEQPVVAVSAGSSQTVKIDVKATDSAQEGTQTVMVDVSSDGALVKQVPFTVNVQKTGSTVIGGNTTTPTSSNVVLILTVVLVIIFVVLLIVLIVLLTKRPAQSEEFGETSYY